MLLFILCLFSHKGGSFIIRVYLKPTFTALYTNWNECLPKSHQMNLISTLVYRALMICSLQELEKTHRTFATMVILLMSLNSLFRV